ncbi:MAG: hypothetical protein WCT99_10235 [Bacteroidota bacterium]|jgi:hypothetical protein
MKNIFFPILFFSIAAILTSGCATVFKGYLSEVNIKYPSEDIKVKTVEGQSFPVKFGTKKTHVNTYYLDAGMVPLVIPDSSVYIIQLRSNKDYHLVLKDSVSEFHYYAYPKLNGWWFALDIVCGGIPAWIDAYTGNWNDFDDIDCNTLQNLKQQEEKNNLR